MTTTQQRAAIKAVLDADQTAAKVYDYERFTNDYSGFLDFFKTVYGGVERVFGWTVAYSGQSREPVSFSTTVTTTRWLIRGFMSLDDSAATEKLFETEVQSVMDALDAAASLHTAASAYDAALHYTGRAQNQLSELRLIGSVLCHYAEVTVEIQEKVAL